MTEQTSPKISLRLAAKVTWDFNSVGVDLEYSDDVKPGQTRDEALADAEGWVEENVERIVDKFKEEVSAQYAPKRTRNR